VNADEAPSIVPMTERHLPEILAIERACFRDPWPLRTFCDLIAEPATSWVALKEGRVIGYLLTLWVMNEIHLLNIAVQADMRCRGVGRQLMAFLLQKAHAQGIRIISLEVRVSNQVAIEFYQKAGFRCSYRRKSYYDDGEDAWMMEYRIPKPDAPSNDKR